MICSLCGQRKARRACPALDRHICAVCCGTKRLTEINCPSDCAYLVVARAHPPAATLRQHQRDVGLLMQFVRDFNQRQSELFLVVCTYLAGYPSADLQPLIDDDVAEAAAALASTLETASRGVIYEHRPASLTAERLAAGLKRLLTETGAQGGPGFDRDAAIVLRHIHEGVADVRAQEPENRRAFLDLIRRVIRKPDARDGAEQPEPPRLIVP